MRNIIFFLLLLAFAAPLSAQVSVNDSTWIRNEAGIFFEYKTTDYMSGESALIKKKLGDTIQVLNNYKQDFLNITSNWATDVQWTSTITRKVTELIRYDASIAAMLDTSPVKAIIADNLWMVDSTFKIKSGSAAKNIRFTVNAAGVLRYKIDTFATRTAIMLGSIIRLNNYLNTGSPLDLYQFPDKRWRDITRAVQLYTVYVGSATREAPPPAEPISPAAPAFATFDGGVVLLNGKYWKYNGTKKKWLPAPAPTTTALKL